MKCESCQTLNQSVARFCHHCGQPLEVAADGAADRVPARTEEHQRRHVTVMFVDVVDSTSLARQFDVEEWQDVLRAYHDVCQQEMDAHGGTLAHCMGDGVLGYFGFPRSYEDNARRAVMAALGIIQQFESRQPGRLADNGSRLRVRVGIADGVLMTSKTRDGVLRAEGLALHLAARLQQEAHANGVVITPDVLRMVEGCFHCESMGTRNLRGFSEPVELYSVLGEGAARTRMEAEAHKQQLPVLVGREQEMESVLHAWEDVQQGTGRAVHVIGDAGIGKSRLAHEVADTVSAQGSETWFIQCSAIHQATALHPVIDALERMLSFDARTSADAKAERVRDLLRDCDRKSAPTVALIASLLGPMQGAPPAPPGASLELQREQTLELVTALLIQLGREKPALVIFEDLHWADPTTIELLRRAHRRLGDAGILLYCTARPGFSFDEFGTADTVELVLERLPDAETRTLVGNLCMERELASVMQDRIVERSEGVPLFAEEITRAVLDIAAKEPLIDLTTIPALPFTLRDSLTARLDQNPALRPVVEVCAVLGRSCAPSLLAAVMDETEQEARRHLNAMAEAGIMLPPQGMPALDYLFKHALIQEAAYRATLRSKRRELHRRAAETLVRCFPQIGETRPMQIAEHYAACGELHAAAGLALKAGMQSLGRSANIECTDACHWGLETLRAMAESPEKDDLELCLLTTCGVALIATRGFAAEEVGTVFARAEELWSGLGRRADRIGALWGLWVYHLVRADLDEATQHATAMIEIGVAAADSSIEVEGRWTLGDTLCWQGNLNRAHEELEAAIALYDPQRHEANKFLYGQDPGVAAHCYDALALLGLGQVQRSGTRLDEALRRADAMDHPFSIGWALSFIAMLATMDEDVPRVLSAAQRSVQHAAAQFQPFWLHACMQFQAWAVARTGDVAGGLALMEEGSAGFAAIGSITVRPYFMALHAEVSALSGRHAEAHELVGEALALAVRTGQHALESDILRITGDIHMMQHASAAAAAHYHQAIKVADATGMPMQALRAAVRLAETSPGEESWHLLSVIRPRVCAHGRSIWTERATRCLART